MIKKQIAIFGPTITFVELRKIKGLQISTSGDVLSLSDDPSQTMQSLIDNFTQLSPFITRRIIEPLYPKYKSSIAGIQAQRQVTNSLHQDFFFQASLPGDTKEIKSFN